MKKKEKISSVYIHIPFCTNICSYCDFAKILYNKKYVLDYLESLSNEIKSNYKGDIINTLYIGGGTPSSLDIDEIRVLLDSLKVFKLHDNYEYTIECNIESINEDKLKLFKLYGINRISIGVQTFQDKYISLLNRHHNKKMAKEKIILVKKYFDNINVDLIYAIPNQTLRELKDDLNTLLSLDIPHVSLYSLIIEEHTKLYIDGVKNIDEELDFNMYELINDILSNNGYIHYEVSNYSKIGYESKHNLNYWNNNFYYGFGMGASGYIDSIRYTNTFNIKKYINGHYRDTYDEVSDKEKLENEFILGLRKIKGINKKDFNNKYNFDIMNIEIVKKLVLEGKLISDDNIYINSDYIYVSNEILIKFLGEV